METRRQTLLNAAPPSPSNCWSAADIGRTILIVHLLLSPLIFSNDTVEAFEYPKAALLTLTALALLPFALWNSRPNSWGQFLRDLVPTWRDPLAWGFVLFVVSAVASTVFSLSPGLSFWGAPDSHAGLITVAGYCVLFFVTRHLCRDTDDAWPLLAAAVVGTCIASAYAGVQVARIDPIAWDSVSTLELYVRPFGTMAHPNFLAGYLATTLPLLLLFADRALHTRQWVALAILAVGGAAATAAIVMACSRGGWLASAVALAGCIVGWLALGRGRRVMLTVVAVVPLALVGLWIVSKINPHAYDPLQALGQRLHRFAIAGGRKEIWRIALALFREQPVFGTGLDTFHLAFGQKRTIAFWMVEWNTTPLRAHNEVLQTLATQGLFGLGALLVMVGGLLVTAVRAARQSSREARLLGFALAAGIAAFIVQDCLSFTVIGQGTLFVTFAALLSRLSQGPAEEASGMRPRFVLPLGLICAGTVFILLLWHNIDADSARTVPGWRWGMLIVVGTLLAGCRAVWNLASPSGTEPKKRAAELETVRPAPAVWLVRISVGTMAIAFAYSLVLSPLQADLACRRGDRLLAADATAALRSYEEATARAPEDAFYWAKLGAAARSALAKTSDRALRSRLAEVGRRAYARAVELCPTNASYHVGLGRMYMELTRLGQATPQQAIDAYEQAVKLDSNNAIYYADAANAAVVMEQIGAARHFAQEGVDRYPWCGILWAQAGYADLLDHNPADAVQHLSFAVAQQWYGEIAAQRFAEAMLSKARQQAGR